MPLNFNHPKLDAAENTFLRRALEEVRAQTFDIKFPEFKGRMFVPVDNSVNNGAELVSFDTFAPVGEAQISADMANDGPAVDTFATSEEQRIFSILAHYSYTIQDIRAGMAAGQEGLDSRKARIARRAVEQVQDRILLLGDTDYSMQGLFTLTGALTFVIVPGDSAQTAIETLTPDEAVNRLNGIVNHGVETTLEVEIPDTMIVALSVLNYITNTRMGDGSDSTILMHFLKNQRYITSVESSIKLEVNAALPWGANDRRTVVYKRSAEKLQGIIPQEFEQFAPEVEGPRTKTVVHARAGGVQPFYPQSVVYADGL